MQIGDLVRTTQQQYVYGYKRPVCIIVAIKSRIDGTYIEVIDQEGTVRPWWPEELEVISASR
jgi:hypothetical protein